MLESLEKSEIDPPPIFGSLRQFIHPDREHTKVVLIAVSEAHTPQVKQVIYKHLGDLSQPDTGILFVVPIEEVEGLSC